MRLFEVLDEKMSHSDTIQVDGAFAIVHVRNDVTSELHEANAGAGSAQSGSLEMGSAEYAGTFCASTGSFVGTKSELSMEERLDLWRRYWYEYISAFDTLTRALPDSVATAYMGGHAVELGFKYVLLAKSGSVERTHSLGRLSELVIRRFANKEKYLDWVVEFCESYELYLKGGHFEYFRYPEYGKGVASEYYAGSCFDVSWISYNLALITLKLLHLSGLDVECERYLFRQGKGDV